MMNTFSARATSIAAAAAPTSNAISRRAAMLAFATASALALVIPFTSTARAEPAATGFVYTADEYGNTVSRIDLKNGKIDIVPVSITPHNVQFVPEKNLVLAVGLPNAEKAQAPENGEEGGHGGGGHGGSPAAGQLIILETADISSGPKTSISVGAHRRM